MTWAESLINQTVGHYEPVKCLGEGGMGSVFMGEHPTIESRVAIKVLDFGVAKLLGDDDAMGELTATGMIIGSPQYMSPEQCLDSKSVDPRTDIFSLAAMGYVLLSGRLPYPGQSLGQSLWHFGVQLYKDRYLGLVVFEHHLGQ